MMKTKTFGTILGWGASGLAGMALLAIVTQPSPDYLAALFAGVFVVAGITLIHVSGQLE